MRICFSVPPEQPSLQSIHFGSSGRFMLFDSKTNCFTSQPNAAACSGACHCALPELEGIDVVICQAMGHKLLRQLRERGIPVLHSLESELSQALALWRQQQLPELPRAVCFQNRRGAPQSIALTRMN